MELTPEKIRWILIYMLVLVVSIALHEFGHAIVAHKLGDDTPSRQGRVTLNPLAHADPIGTFLLPLAGSLFSAASGTGGGFGWGKPVQWNPHRIRRGISMATAKVLVAIAGPSMNVLLAVVVSLVHVILLRQNVIGFDSQLNSILFFVVQMNFMLFFFNLLPVPPLDGGHVLESFVPYRHRETYEQIAKYSPFLLLAVLLIPQVSFVFRWPAAFLTTHLYQLFGHLLGAP